MSQVENNSAINELKLNINGKDITFDNNLINEILASKGNFNRDLTNKMHENLKAFSLNEKPTININTYNLKEPVDREVTRLEHVNLSNFKDLDLESLNDDMIEEILGMEKAANEQLNTSTTKIQALQRGKEKIEEAKRGWLKRRRMRKKMRQTV